MVAYSFRPRFVDAILWGRKDQTIRAPRRNHAAVGDNLQLYTGMRTKNCRLILHTICTETMLVDLRWYPHIRFIVDGAALSIKELDAFARRDGFIDLIDMKQFWLAEHPGKDCFGGTLIRWKPLASPVEMGTTINEARP